MTDKEQNRSEVEETPTPKDASTGMNLLGKDRRRFIKRAIIAAPFILTVTSRPVWACNCTLSGQLSGNLSDQDGPPCEGCTPGKWKNWAGIGHGNQTNLWSTEYPQNMSFSSAFGVDAFMDGWGESLSLLKVLLLVNNNHNTPLEMLGYHAVAALQNAAVLQNFGWTPQDVINKFVAGYNSGEFEDTKDDFNLMNDRYCPL